jgi:DNA-directed RNA polymerase specialized sigma24 family protein
MGQPMEIPREHPRPIEAGTHDRAAPVVPPAVSPEALHAARTSVAARLLANQPTLLAFIRRRLGHSAASERNADDVFATTLRRSDALVRANALLAELSDAALMALASTISHRAILESSRQAERARRVRASAAERSRAQDGGGKAAPRDGTPELEDALRSKLSEEDLAILVLRLDDRNWSAIAAALGTTPAGAHRRYYRALKALMAATGVRDACDPSTRPPPTR